MATKKQTKKESTSISLTEKQVKVLKAIINNSGNFGGDFALVDEVIASMKRSRLTSYQIGAVITTLIEKGLISVSKIKTDKTYKQISFDISIKQLEKVIA